MPPTDEAKAPASPRDPSAPLLAVPGADRPSGAILPGAECKGIRSTTDFPRDLTGLSAEQIAHHYQAMRNSHAALSRSRGQLQRRSRELSAAREQFLSTLRHYEERLLAIGQEKAEALRLAQDMHQELEAFESKQQALDRLLDDLDEAKKETGFWSIFHITRLIEHMRTLLRGGLRGDG
jgi:signal transduction histidine kinase